MPALPLALTHLRPLVLALLAGCSAAAWSQAPVPPPPTIEHCAAIGAPADRLACYDRLAGRAPAATEPAARQPLNGSVPAAPPTTSKLAPTNAALPGSAESPADSSLLSKYWELAPADKRGIFNFVGYQPNYVLPLHLTSRINRAPASPTQATVLLPDYRRDEAKFQLSLRTKLAQDVGLAGGDVWVAFSQQVLWQIYNGADSKPFRNTDYQPEAMYVVPTAERWRALPFGWQWRYTQLGLAHQSNGQSDPLSRSWNRVYLGAGFERGDWSLLARFNQRLNEPLANDNNPDLVAYRGRWEFQLNWAQGLQTASLLWRTTLTDARYGALQLEWTTPVFRDQPNGLRWFVQAFSGYGETLTDYNFRQNSIGAGVTFLQF
ncbi:MAG TPA: phospholipase A [Burkholderiaceae bacterium]|nr:phospholipase A [Burkholderiaceae bacterium]